MDKFSYISNADVSFIDDLYKKYKSSPDSVDVSWQRFFEGFEFSLENFNGSASTSARQRHFVGSHISVCESADRAIATERFNASDRNDNQSRCRAFDG